jgi:hypothetical protein
MAPIKEIMQKAVDLVILAERDQFLYGDCLLEIGERSIALIKPKDISYGDIPLLTSEQIQALRDDPFFDHKGLPFEVAIKEMELNLRYQI